MAADSQDVVWVDVLPSMDKLVPSLRRALPSAGRQAGEMFGQSLTDAAASKIDSASSKMTGALKKVQDATGQVAVAEAKLQALRDKEVADAGRLAAAEEAVNRARRSETSANEALAAASRGVAAAQEKMASATRLSSAAEEQATRQAGQLARAQAEASASTDKVSTAHRALGGIMSGIGSVASRAWFPITAALGAAGGLGIKTASNMEQAQIAFTNMLGSGQKAQAFLQQLADFAAKTPFEFTDVTAAAQKLMAMGIQAQDVLPDLTAIGDAVSAMGGGKEQIDQVTTAIGQMSAKGKIQSDELLQLTEAGIPALQILANSYGVSNSKMQDMITAGDVLSSDALPKLISGLENGTKTTQAFGGMMAQQSQSLKGLWSDFADTMKQRLSSMWQPLIPSMKAALSNATPVISNWLANISQLMAKGVRIAPTAFSAVKDFFSGGNFGADLAKLSIPAGVTSALTSVRNLFTEVLKVVHDLGPALAVILGGGLRLAWQGFQILLPAVTNVLDFLDQHRALLWTIAGAWAALALATKAHAAALAVEAAGGMVAWIKQANIVQGITKAWAAVQWLLNAAMEANPIILITTVLIALGVAIYEAWQHSQTFRDVVLGVWHAIGDAVSFVWNSVIKPVIGAVVAGWNGLVTAFQWAWQNILKPVWDALGVAASLYWNFYLHPILIAIVAAWTGMVTAVSWAWENILRPVWTVIADAAMVLYRIVAVVVLGAIEGAWWLMVNAAKLAWESVLKPTWDAIAAGAAWLWNNVLSPIWGAMQAAWSALLTAFQWAWQNILRPTWDAITAAAQWLWNNILSPIWAAMKAGWDGLLTGFQWAWNNILKPTWDALSAAANWLWNNVLSPIWTTMGNAWSGLVTGMKWVHDNILAPMWTLIIDAVNSVKGAFDTVVAGIKGAWNTLMDVVATPINFVIEVVFNKGLFTAWNWVVDNLGLPGNWHAPHWSQVSRGQQFAAGGQIPGPYLGPAADNVPGVVPTRGGMMPIRVNPREWIIPVGPSDHLGPQRMEAIRAGRISREGLDLAMALTGPGFAAGGQIPGLAGGGQTYGLMENWIRQNQPGVIITSDYRPGANDYHGSGNAIDMSFPGNPQSKLMPLADFIARTWSHITELIHNPNGSIKNGQAVPASFWGAATWAQHANHVHWAMTMADWLQGNKGGSGPGATSVFAAIGDVLSKLTDSITGPVKDLLSRFGSPFGQILSHAPGRLLGGMWDATKGKIGEIINAVNPANSDFDVQTTGPIQDQVKSAFHAFHPGWESGAEWAGVDYVVSHESGWNPKAKNPSSTASGLFQFINSTWAAYRSDAAGQYARAMDAPVHEQAFAGANYMSDRYGDPIGAENYWKVHHNYGGGGQVPAFDQGGLWGPGPGWNGTGDLERVLAPEQDDYFRRFVDATGSHGGSAGRGPLIGSVNLGVTNNDGIYQAMDELEHRLRVADLGGRYST